MNRIPSNAAAALARTWTSESRARVESRVLVGILLASAATVAVSAWSRSLPPAGAPADPAVAPAEIGAPAPNGAGAIGTSSRTETAETVSADGDGDAHDAPARPPEDRARWKEGQFYRDFASRPIELAAASALLESDASGCEKVALLRAAYDQSGAPAPELFELAITRLPDAAEASGASVPEAMVQWLAERAPRERAARGILERCVLDATSPASRELRVRAARALISAAPDEDRPRLLRRFELERDDHVRAGAKDAFAAAERAEADG
jgi:hypothetical protein